MEDFYEFVADKNNFIKKQVMELHFTDYIK